MNICISNIVTGAMTFLMYGFALYLAFVGVVQYAHVYFRTTSLFENTNDEFVRLSILGIIMFIAGSLYFYVNLMRGGLPIQILLTQPGSQVEIFGDSLAQRLMSVLFCITLTTNILLKVLIRIHKSREERKDKKKTSETRPTFDCRDH